MKKKKQNLLLVTGLVVTSALVLGACSNDESEKEEVKVETDVNNDSKENATETENKVENKTENNAVVDEKEGEESINKEEKTSEIVFSENGEVLSDEFTKSVKVYKPDAQAENLVEEEITIILDEESKPETQNIDLINHLVHLSNTMPGEVSLETLVIEDKVLKLNFGESITKVQGSTGGLMFMNSITETIFNNFEEDVVESIVFVYGDGETNGLDHVTVNEEIKRK